MSVTNIVRAVFPSVHKFVFAALLLALTQFSYADMAASWGASLTVRDVSRSKRSDTKSGHVNGLQRPALCFQPQC